MKMRRILLGAMVVLAVSTVASAGYDWMYYNGHSYALTLSTESWADAETEAVGLGGHLVTVNDAAENTWLTSAFLTSSSNPPVQYYIGLSTPLAHPSATWTWVDGSTAAYRNWHLSQPDGQNGSNPVLWATIMGGGGAPLYGSETLGFWNDASSSPKYGIIEAVHTPVPGAIVLASLGTVAVTWLRRRRSLIS